MSDRLYVVVCEDADFEWSGQERSPKYAAETAVSECISRRDVTYDGTEFDVTVMLGLSSLAQPGEAVITYWRVTVEVSFTYSSHPINPPEEGDACMELWQAPGGRTHLCWGSAAFAFTKSIARPKAACRSWWPDLDTWLPILDGGEITCQSCRRGTTITHVPAWSLPELAPDVISQRVMDVRARWAAGLPAVERRP